MLWKTPFLRSSRSSRAAMFVTLMFCVGCSERDPGPEVITLEGKVENVHRSSDTTGQLTVRFYSDKQKQEIVGTAQVTQETEIMIDGVAGTFKDIRLGESVRGEVRVEKKGGQKTQTILKIQVIRPHSGGG